MGENINLKENQHNSKFMELPYVVLYQRSCYLIGKFYFKCAYYKNAFKYFKMASDRKIVNDAKILKKALYQGNTITNGLDFYLDIASRLGYIGLLINDQKQIESAQKKIIKALDIIKNDSKDQKLVTLKTGYSFITTILQINCKKNVKDLKEVAASFRSNFLSNINRPVNFIVTDMNQNDCIMNLNIINNMDHDISNLSRNLIEHYLSDINRNNPLQINEVMTFIIGVHGLIKYLSESYCTDPAPLKQIEYKEKIIQNAEQVLSYVKSQIDNTFSFINTDFIKSALIEIFSAYAHVFIYNNKLQDLQKAIILFDDISKKIGINEKIPSYDLVLKIKGDNWRFRKDFPASCMYYESALKIMDKHNPRRGIVYFNLGCVYYFDNSRNKAIENLNRAINEFNNMTQNSELFDFYKRTDNINNKKVLAQRMIDLLMSQEKKGK